MRNKRKTEIRVGITVFAGLIILLWIIGWAKNVSFLDDEKRLRVKFDNVAGLEVGDQVAVNGVRTGYVESIENRSDGVLVTFNLPGNVKLKKDAEFSIMMLDLMGGKKVEITPGVSEEPIDFQTVHIGSFKGDISTAMAALSGVQEDMISGVKELRITLNSLNKLLGDKEFLPSVKAGVISLGKLADNLNSIVIENRTALNDLLNSSNSLVRNLDETVNEQTLKLDTLFAEIRSALSSSEELMSSIKNIVAETNNRENNLGKILYDKDLMKNLTNSIDRLNKLTKLLIEQLENDGINVDANVDIF